MLPPLIFSVRLQPALILLPIAVKSASAVTVPPVILIVTSPLDNSPGPMAGAYPPLSEGVSAYTSPPLILIVPPLLYLPPPIAAEVE